MYFKYLQKLIILNTFPGLIKHQNNTCSAASTWNILPSEVVMAKTVNVFKDRIDKDISTIYNV